MYNKYYIQILIKFDLYLNISDILSGFGFQILLYTCYSYYKYALDKLLVTWNKLARTHGNTVMVTDQVYIEKENAVNAAVNLPKYQKSLMLL